MEEKINHLENFIDLRKERIKSNKEKINNQLYDTLYNSSTEFLKYSKLDSKKTNYIIQNIKSTKVRNFDDVIDIYFYESKYSNTNKELQQAILYLSTFLCVNFSYNDFKNLENIIQNDNGIDSEIATEFYVRIAESFKKHEAKMGVFLMINFLHFSQNKKIICSKLLARLNGINKSKKPWWKFW